MSEGFPTQEALFDDGPFPHFQNSLELFWPTRFRRQLRVISVLLAGWAPLTILVTLQALIQHDYALISFFSDFAVHARSLAAAPLFLISEYTCLPLLRKIALHFLEGGLIQDGDRKYFDAVVASTRRLTNSTSVEVVAIVLAYVLVAGLVHYLPQGISPPWYSPQQRGFPHLSWAGWWYALVSLPLLLVILFSWFWRIILWARFLFLVSRLKLSLIPAHPDRSGGLKFLDISLFAFIPVGFTIGMVAAGTAANQVVRDRLLLQAIQKPVIGLVIFVLLLFVGPLMVFAMNLRYGIQRGVFQYGALASAMGVQFEKKWLQAQSVSGETLAAPDFSATTDLYSIAANVGSMSVLPFDIKSVIVLIIFTLLPFLPVALLAVPLGVILKEAEKLLL